MGDRACPWNRSRMRNEVIFCRPSPSFRRSRRRSRVATVADELGAGRSHEKSPAAKRDPFVVSVQEEALLTNKRQHGPIGLRNRKHVRSAQEPAFLYGSLRRAAISTSSPYPEIFKMYA